MPTPTFPTTLPNVVMTNYGFKPGNPLVRTEMEAGLARVRRRFVSVPTDFTVQWEFTIGELAIFEKFYEQDLLQGAAWFNIKLVNGVGETIYLARFKEQYSVNTSHREFYWTVSATLEVLNRPLIASGSVQWDGGLANWDGGITTWIN